MFLEMCGIVPPGMVGRFEKMPLKGVQYSVGVFFV